MIFSLDYHAILLNSNPLSGKMSLEVIWS